MIPLVPRLISFFCVGRMVLYGLIYFSISSLLSVLAFNYITLCASLFLFGSGSCLFNVSINSLTGTIEKSDGVMIMLGSHGFFSAGGIVGAGLSGIVASKLGNPLLHNIIVILILVVTQFYFRHYIWHIRCEFTHQKRVVFHSYKPLF